MDNKPRIAVIMSTTREGRLADKVATWLMKQGAGHSDLAFELVDLRDYPMPFFNEQASSMWMPSGNHVARIWQEKISQFDGYIFITAEYNHSIPAVLKNALDYSYSEWARKPVAFVGYGGVGAARAVEHLRLISIELQMAPMRTAVHVAGSDFMAVWKGDGDLSAMPYTVSTLNEMFDQLSWWTLALGKARHSGEDQSANASEAL